MGGLGRGGETHVKNGGFQYGCKTQATVGNMSKVVSLFNGSRQEFGSSKVTCGFAKQFHVCIYVICLFSLIYLVIHIPWKLLR